MLSTILEKNKDRVSNWLRDPTQEEQKEKHLLDQKWNHHTILLIVSKGNYNMKTFKEKIS
jgi:hypothetical protein